MTFFKAGDKVICIRKSPYSDKLELNKVYTIEVASGILVILKEAMGVWSYDRFELVIEKKIIRRNK